MGWSSLVKKIEDAAEDLAVLTINTVVTGTPTPGGEATPDVLKLSTRIDQISGDIDNSFSESTYKLEYGQSVLSFHERQVSEGKEILERNIAAVKELLSLAIQNLSGDGGTAGDAAKAG